MIRLENFRPVPAKLIAKAISAAALLTILFWSLLVNPEQSNLLTCYFHALTGHPCPTCGLSHSFYAVSHLQLHESFKFHPMGPVIFIVMLFLFVKFLFEIVARQEIKIRLNPKITKATLIIFSFSWLSFWIIRLMNDR